MSGDEVVADAAKRALFLGYYYADGQYGDYFSDLSGYTNTYLSWARMQYSHFGTEPNSAWRASMADKLKRAYASGKYILLQLNGQDPRDIKDDMVKRVLEIASPFWDKVIAVELGDEVKWDRPTTKQHFIGVRDLIAGEKLSQKPLGITYFTDRGLSDDAEWKDIMLLPQFDWVGLECYLPLPYTPGATSQMKSNVRAHRGCLPDGRRVWLTMMGYTRNKHPDGSPYVPIPAAVKAQQACYDLALESARTMGMTIFSYGRASGTFEHPELKVEHQRISTDMRSRGIYA